MAPAFGLPSNLCGFLLPSHAGDLRAFPGRSKAGLSITKNDV
jgi:hypothetical protein